ncbi:MAG TPA: hypothetical protein PKD52_09930 [Clostridiales bacterium]|nr:hypothetical protein [Clostridiales bacterium]
MAAEHLFIPPKQVSRLRITAVSRLLGKNQWLMGTTHHYGGHTAEDLHLYSITLEHIQYDLIKMISQSSKKNNRKRENIFVNSCDFDQSSREENNDCPSGLMTKFIMGIDGLKTKINTHSIPLKYVGREPENELIFRLS